MDDRTYAQRWWAQRIQDNAWYGRDDPLVAGPPRIPTGGHHATVSDTGSVARRSDPGVEAGLYEAGTPMFQVRCEQCGWLNFQPYRAARWFAERHEAVWATKAGAA